MKTCETCTDNVPIPACCWPLSWSNTPGAWPALICDRALMTVAKSPVADATLRSNTEPTARWLPLWPPLAKPPGVSVSSTLLAS